ncbi:MAG: hypothetical protein O7C98_01090 [Planctomycetota bacterium]|nr:hypothetical protein [Planctomycetota bacterium]
MRGRAAALAGVLCLAALLFAGEDAMRPRVRDPATRDGLRRADAGCIGCHGGVEVMHPWKALSCTECHGGDGGATTRDRAHVRSSLPVPNDERTPPLNYDLNYRRFANPADLRVINKTCGTCHAEECVALRKSLHGTTAGHLSDGLYENGVIRSRTRRFSMFSVRDEDGTVPEHAYSSMPQIPAPTFARKDDIGSHFADLPRKSCMQCHLYSRGLGVRGRLGQDGWYRGEGCAACHVTYGRDGLSHSADASLDKLEPGHPLRHQMTTKIPTETCTRCHALDANIGMSFRGLGQLPPGVPGGPDVPGTTNVLSKGRFFINDPAICPADVHRERGMHCIDCHNSTDVMGDGNIWGVMEHAVGVECSTCHGTFTQKATFETSRGEKLDHLKWEAGEAVLTGRVTGRKHVVKQVKDVLDRRSRHYNPRAARAMTGDHARLTCYACHSAWSVNFFGFHFDRNESFDQLDIIAGRRTPGRVSTQEKIFATFRHYYLGWDSAGRIAPYMVGFSTAGTYRDKSGDVVLRQEFPRTAAGLSGMTMIHHQVHTVQPVARRCAECHSAPSVLGMGSQNFHLFRDLFITVGDAGLTVCGFDVKNPAQSRGLVNLPLPSRPLDVALLNDSISGRARYAYVPLANGTVRVVDVSDPVSPRLGVKLDVQGAEAVLVREGMLFVAAGEQGLQLYSLDAPKRPRHVARVRTQNAHRVFVDGLYAYVADGRGGLRIVDLTIPHKPAVVATVDLNGSDSAPLDTRAVLVHYTPARPVVKEKRRTVGRNIA